MLLIGNNNMLTVTRRRKVSGGRSVNSGGEGGFTPD